MTTVEADRDAPPSRPDSIVRNAAYSYAAQLTTASLTALLTIFLVRTLGPHQYGLFALALSMSTIAMSVADAGISGSTARFVAERRTRRGEVGALIVDGLKLKVLVTGALCLVLAILAGPIARAYGEPDLAWPLRAIALATLGQSLVLMLLLISNALGRTVMNLRIVAVESVLEFSATVTLVLLGAGAIGAAAGRAVGFVLGAIIGVALVLRLVGRPSLRLGRAPRRATVRHVGAYASALLVVDTAYTMSTNATVLLLGAYLGSAASAVFQAPWKLLSFLQYVGLSLANGVAPRLARHAVEEPNVGALQTSLRALIGFQCLLLAPAVVWAEPITTLLLGDRYAESADVLTALTPTIFFMGLAPLLSLSVNYLGEARRRVPIALMTLLLAVVCAVGLIPRHGAVGAAIATDIGYGFYTLAHLWLCTKLVRLRLETLAWSLACGLTAAAGMAIGLALVGTRDLTAPEFITGAAGGLAIYVSMLVFTRELTLSDIARAARMVRAGVRPGRGSEAMALPEHHPAAAAAAATGEPMAAPATASSAIATGPMELTASRAAVSYEIGWSSDGTTGVFELRRAAAPGGSGEQPVASSEPVSWGWRIPPAPVPRIAKVQADLVDDLIATGWRRAGDGAAWYAARFERDP